MDICKEHVYKIPVWHFLKLGHVPVHACFKNQTTLQLTTGKKRSTFGAPQSKITVSENSKSNEGNPTGNGRKRKTENT